MKEVRLRAVETMDLIFLHKLRQDPLIEKNLKFYWPISYDSQNEWFKTLSNNLNNKILIIEAIDRDNKELLEWTHIGDARIQHIDHLNKTAEIGLDICEKFRGKGLGKLSFKTIMDFCFNKLAMRKLYLYVFSFNKSGITVYEKNGFKIEGILKEHVYKDGKYEDLILMSVFKEDILKGQKNI